jgi:hypothetical protein
MVKVTEPGKMPEDALVFLIYSADILGTEDEIETMGPFRKPTRVMPHAEPFPGDWQQTEGDEQYEYGYLGNESGNHEYFPAGFADAEGLAEPQDDEPVGIGRHRKWVGYLNRDQWEWVAERLCIDLDEDTFLPVEFENTMGAITEWGVLPAIAIDNTEGWNPTQVIDSTIFMSVGVSDPNEPEAA